MDDYVFFSPTPCFLYIIQHNLIQKFLNLFGCAVRRLVTDLSRISRVCACVGLFVRLCLYLGRPRTKCCGLWIRGLSLTYKVLKSQLLPKI